MENIGVTSGGTGDLHRSHVLLSRNAFGSTFQKAWLSGTLANRPLFWSHNKKSGDGPRWLCFGRGARDAAGERGGTGAGDTRAPDRGGGAELTFPPPGRPPPRTQLLAWPQAQTPSGWRRALRRSPGFSTTDSAGSVFWGRQGQTASWLQRAAPARGQTLVGGLGWGLGDGDVQGKGLQA